jgi:CheY-like chemotaxis protein
MPLRHGQKGGYIARMKHLVLLVDDEPHIRMFLRKALQERFRVVEAGNGEEALTQIQREPPRMVIMDLEMPVMDGLVAAAEMRKFEEMQGVPLIALTGYEADDLVKKLRSVGFSYFVRKDANATHFIQKVLEIADGLQP